MENYNKFEKARLVGARALQLSSGAPPLIKINKKEDTYIDIAKRELEKGILPITVKRATD
ncbi:MAG: RNA polymerase Rpb6 [Candidatus Parvarchaeum acidophilus ARMAN-5_'5-way FS']|jgi:DNA-directed RNA polymerase subunit K/omega|uniref:DNA-directed RNA polymerase subunit Rpo6 n=1 Tax=Candidatus Parvarchaeum acidophilus ARMAN-5_'5-way FS' TaxID=994838 RepID=F2UU80_PARA5|nr:MAG: RNA polymerase Rpb6 [Candidatus Parvarchaeum acidophilus ARMAN-5_'5-way FS']